MAPPRILVAGIGNIFMGDDAFGCEVAQRLAGRFWPAGVRVKDFGIRGMDLAYAILDGYDAVILIDAVPRGGQPGTVYLIEPDLTQVGQSQPMTLDAHTLDPLKVLGMVKALGGGIQQLLLVGCEPADLGSFEEGRMGLSEAVAGALDDAVATVSSLVLKILAEGPASAITRDDR